MDALRALMVSADAAIAGLGLEESVMACIFALLMAMAVRFIQD